MLSYLTHHCDGAGDGSISQDASGQVGKRYGRETHCAGEQNANGGGAVAKEWDQQSLDKHH